MVALVVASLTGIIHTNLENASPQTSIAVLPALLRGSLPTKSISFCIGLCATSDANNPNLECCADLLRAYV